MVMTAEQPDTGMVRYADAPDGASLGYVQSGIGGISVVAPLCFGTTIDGVSQAVGQQTFLNALAAAHQLVAYDQRGAGTSRPAGASRSWEQRARDCWAVVDAAAIERVVLYGVFDAGFTIAYAALQQPERVLGLIFNLVPPAGTPAWQQGGASGRLRDTWLGDGRLTAPERAVATLRGIGIATADAEALVGAWEDESMEQERELYRVADLSSLAPSLRARSLVIEPQRRPQIAGWGKALADLLPSACLMRPSRAGETLGGIHGFLAAVDLEHGHYASRLNPSFSAAVGATERAVTSLQRIVVPIVDSVSSERAAEMACRLGGPQGAEIVLVHVVEVPLTRALSDVGGEERTRGEKALNLGQAIVGHHGMRSRSRLLVERSAARGILRVVEEEGADVVVMARSGKQSRIPEDMSPTMREALHRAPCEVLVDQPSALRADAQQARFL